MRGDRVEIGRDVAGQLAAAVRSADPSGCEHTHPGAGGDGHRRRHGGGPDVPALPDCHGDIAFGCFARRAENSLVFIVGQTEPYDTVEHCGDRRHGTAGSHCCGASLECLTVVRRRQSEVREDRRLERHDRAAPIDRSTDFLGTDRCQHPARLRVPRPTNRRDEPTARIAAFRSSRAQITPPR